MVLFSTSLPDLLKSIPNDVELCYGIGKSWSGGFEVRKYIIGFICGAIIFSAGTAFGAGSSFTATVGAFRLVVNGKETRFSQQPVVINGSVYVPVRSFADATELLVSYDPNSRTIGLDNPYKELYLQSQKQTDAQSDPGFIDVPVKDVVLSGEETKPNASTDRLEKQQQENERHRSEIQKIEDDYLKYKASVQDLINQIRLQGTVGNLSDSEYESQRNAIQTEILGLQNRLNTYLMDNSFEGQSKKKELQTKISEFESKLTELDNARSLQLRVRNLENMLIQAQQNYQAKLDAENNLHQTNLNAIR